MTAYLESLERERAFLLIHAGNLEGETRRLQRIHATACEPRIQELEAHLRPTHQRLQLLLEQTERDAQRIAELEVRLRAMLASRTWRVGSAVLIPYRLARRIINRVAFG